MPRSGRSNTASREPLTPADWQPMPRMCRGTRLPCAIPAIQAPALVLRCPYRIRGCRSSEDHRGVTHGCSAYWPGNQRDRRNHSMGCRTAYSVPGSRWRLVVKPALWPLNSVSPNPTPLVVRANAAPATTKCKEFHDAGDEIGDFHRCQRRASPPSCKPAGRSRRCDRLHRGWAVTVR